MAKKKSRDPKLDALKQQGCLNPQPQSVTDPLFASSDFFDSRDLVQVKYEMVRRVRADGQSVAESARAFGFSRPSFYQASKSLEQDGLCGLLPKKRGPRSAHKLGKDMMEFIESQLSEDPCPNSSELASRIEERFNLQVHPRSIERALARKKKRP